jgi:hypothetical protein
MLYFIDIETGHASLSMASDGRPCRLSLYEIKNVGKFVAAALNSDTWVEKMEMVGSTNPS